MSTGILIVGWIASTTLVSILVALARLPTPPLASSATQPATATSTRRACR